MKAVMPDILPDVAAMRKRTGADQWDEMWEGVLHMPPAPNREHQNLEAALDRWLWKHWAHPLGNKVYHQINVASPGGWPNDYRIPDLVLLTPDRFGIDRNEYFDGAPTVVVEIHSPGDETLEKMPFYAKLGVPEVWIVNRNTKMPDLYALTGDAYEKQAPSAEGRLRSAATGVLLCGEGGKLVVERAGLPESRQALPED